MKPRSRASFHSLFTDLLRRRVLAKASRPIHWPITDNAVSQQRECSAFTLPELRERVRAFTLLEMLVVMGVIAILMALVVPAFTNLKSASDVTSAANKIKGVLDTACTYAKANNTYTWVGFFEENVSNPASPNASAPAIGRVVMSIVASKDGTNVATTNPIDPTKLIQVGKLTKIDNVHLWTHTDTPSNAGTTFDTRPNVATTYCIGDTSPTNSTTPFQYPVGNPAPTAQYTFVKAVQFGSDGEARINNSTNAPQTAAEIGLEPTHGAATPSSTPANIVAVQFTGVGGSVTIYRK
jgi:prepilin-type N-terminal cleavage/methylation domain-containing protein